MYLASKIQGTQAYLKSLTVDNVSDNYLSWLNDKDVNYYLESRLLIHTRDSIHEYINKINQSSDYYNFGIFTLSNDLHIGNIKLGPIDRINNRAVIGFLLGEKSYWGKGITTESVRLLVDFSFDVLNLVSIHAGYVDGNVASAKVFEKNFFKIDGVRRSYHKYDQGYLNSIIVSLLSSEHHLKS